MASLDHVEKMRKSCKTERTLTRGILSICDLCHINIGENTVTNVTGQKRVDTRTIPHNLLFSFSCRNNETYVALQMIISYVLLFNTPGG